jgi:hypothetical protein
MLSYTVNLEALCETQNFTPEQIEEARLVLPKGAVPNSFLLWMKVALISGEIKYITLPLAEFYRYIDLPESSIVWASTNKKPEGVSQRVRK